MIKLNDVLIINLEQLKNYKIHFANQSSNSHPLEQWEISPKKFEEWQSYQSKRNFDREYIISFIDFKDRGHFMFAGIYKVLGCQENAEIWDNKNYHKYNAQLTEQYQEYIGRLIIKCKRDRQAYCYLETYIDKCNVVSILEESHAIEHFCGYKNINHSFEKISNIIKKVAKDWSVALSKLKGVYLLIDDSNNKKYIGSAYGDDGIWNRWSNYVYSYTGGNKGLDELHKQVGEEHFKQHFRFVLLENFTNKTPDEAVMRRESFWKEVFNSRNKNLGYNHN